jgi:predicted metal-dependent HD superfamily phosphohydrolase
MAQERKLPYHNWYHVLKCVSFIEHTSAPDHIKNIAILIALYYYIVYNPGSSVNEILSMQVFANDAFRLQMKPEVIEIVKKGIVATDHKGNLKYLDDAPNTMRDAIFLAVDADLSYFAYNPTAFAQGSVDIAAEHTMDPKSFGFKDARKKALSKFLPENSGHPVFRSQWGARYETAALSNLRSL